MTKKTKSNSAILKKNQEINDLKDKYLRLIAEFENYKKRTLKEKEDFAKYAKENLIHSLLPIIDDFERAEKTKEKDIDGYMLIRQKMIDILEKQNVKKIKLTENELFNLEKHEAISSIEVKEKNKKARILYLSAEQFMYKFVQALRFKDMHAFKKLFRSVDVLMVDDVQFIAGKDSTQDEFFHTFNALIEQGKQIVISADRAPGEIDGLEERIKSRLAWGLVVDVHPTDYELRLGILQAKAEIQMELNKDVKIDEGILEYLAHKISSNVRVLEGALTRLFAFASLVGKEINIDLAQECLSDILRTSERKVTIEEIIRKVAEHYNLRMTDLISARRARVVARPRQIAMFLSKSLTSKSLPEIGRKFGGRDHTTVIHAVKKIEELKLIDVQVADEVEILRRTLEA